MRMAAVRVYRRYAYARRLTVIYTVLKYVYTVSLTTWKIGPLTIGKEQCQVHVQACRIRLATPGELSGYFTVQQKQT